MRQNWVKYDVSIGIMLKTGVLVKDEFMLLSYMLNQCDKETGQIITNSRLLSIELDVGRKWVSNLLSSLKKKERIQNPDGAELSLRQKQGNTKPYPILLCDALSNGSLDRDKTEARQRPDRGQTLPLDRRNDADVDESQSGQGVGAVGTDVADQKDLDLEGDKTPLAPQNLVTTSEGQEDENREGGVAPLDEDEKRTVTKVKHIQGLILRKWSKQLKEAPGIGPVKDALREFGGDYKPLAMAITKAASNLNTPTPKAALNLVLTIARNEGGGKGGVTQDQLADREREIKDLEAEVEKAMEYPVENENFISQRQDAIRRKKESLAQLQG